MKKYFYLLSIIVLGLSACKKGDVTAEQASIDDRKIQAFIAANPSISSKPFVKDPSGLYYSIIKPGTGAYPTASSTVQVAYTLKLLNGSTVESSGNSTEKFSLASDVIKGWKIGMPFINSGTPNVPGTAGRIMLIIPSALGYGASGNGQITPNTVLVYTIDLIGISN